jgi:hypothetical protein
MSEYEQNAFESIEKLRQDHLADLEAFRQNYE